MSLPKLTRGCSSFAIADETILDASAMRRLVDLLKDVDYPRSSVGGHGSEFVDVTCVGMFWQDARQ